MARRGVVAMVLAVACADANGPLSIEPNTLTLSIGTRQPLELRAGGRRVGPDQAGAMWTSSNTLVATVSAAGEVLALRSGMAQVTARYSGGSATTDVRVIPTPAGIWLATAGDSFYVFQLNEVRQASSQTGMVSGSLTMQVGSQNDSIHRFTVDGTHTYPAVSLRLLQGSPVATYTGGFENDTSIAGQRAGQGPSPRDLTLTRPTCYCPLFAPGVEPGPSAASCSPQVCLPAPNQP